jgi:protein ImuB
MFACVYAQSIPDGVSLTDFAYSFSPFVEETAPHTIVIDIEGCELLFGSAWQLANDIAMRATNSREAGGLECEVNVAVAENPDAAIHAARFFKAVSFISPGDELACFENFPLWLLDCSLAGVEAAQAEEIFETLKLWGIRTFGTFAALPIVGVSERLGEAGVKLQRLAAGKTKRHLNLKPATPVFANSIELEYPITELEPLSFMLARLLNQLCASLDAYAFATNEIGIDLKLETGVSHERKLSLPYPL